MVGTIIPIVYGDQKKGLRILGLHIAGYVMGAIVLGSLLGSFGYLIRIYQPGKGHAAVALGLLCILCGLRELGLIGFPLPQVGWQVPKKWRSLPRETMSTLYGSVLGFGVANRIGVSTFCVVVLWAVFSQSPLSAAVVLSGFGIGRAIPLIWMSRRSKTASECLSLLDSSGNVFLNLRALSGIGLALLGACFLSAWVARYVMGE
jgi:sulfite exporter TauE/SafE